MKVLVVSHLPEIKFSARQHLGFLARLKEYCEGYQYVSGFELIERRRVKVSASKLYRKYKPDVVILYDSHAPAGKDTLFGRSYFSDLPCKKVVIEVDFYKKQDDPSWYSDNKFDLVVQRGFYTAAELIKLTVPSVWLPFSANEREFFPGRPMHQRVKIVGFAGAFKAPIYDTRRRAMNLLESRNLFQYCKVCRSQKGSKRSYPPFLRNVVAVLSSNYKGSPVGKSFEVMASGTVLLTTWIANETELFGADECYVEYNEDGSDIISLAEQILDNLRGAEEIAMNGYNAFIRRHTHSIRISQLYSYLKDLLDGREVRFCNNNANI